VTATKTRRPVVIGALVVATLVAVVVVVVAVSGSDRRARLIASKPPPTVAIAPPIPVKLTGTRPRWTPVQARGHVTPIVLRADSHGRVVILEQNHDPGRWRLLADDGHGALREIAAQRSGPTPDEADVALDAHDRPIVVWAGGGGLFADIAGHVSTVARGRISMNGGALIGGGDPPNPPALAVSPDGAAVVAWSTVTKPQSGQWIAERRAGATTFGRPRLVGIGEADTPPIVLADQGGEQFAIWGGAEGGVHADIRPPGGSFGHGITLSESEDPAPIEAGVGADGRVVVLWGGFGGLGAVQRSPGASRFDSYTALPLPDGFDFDQISVVVAAHGAQVLASGSVTHHTTVVPEVVARSLPARGRPGPWRRLSNTAVNDDARLPDPAIVATPQGATVVFPPIGHTDRLLAITPSGAPATLRDGGHRFDDPVFASGPHDLIAAWDAPNSPHYKLWVARLRGGGQ
jgi:hypothetical protein